MPILRLYSDLLQSPALESVSTTKIHFSLLIPLKPISPGCAAFIRVSPIALEHDIIKRCFLNLFSISLLLEHINSSVPSSISLPLLALILEPTDTSVLTPYPESLTPQQKLLYVRPLKSTDICSAI